MNKKSVIGRVKSINISDVKGVPKIQVAKATLIEDFGIEGDAHAGKWHRQISLLGIESAQKLIDLGMDGITFGRFAENITTEGIVLYKLPIGTKLWIGCTLHEVTQIGKECHNDCAIKQTIGDCVMPREGIFTKVITGGEIFENDLIRLEVEFEDV
jgi:MOSC domain-containing protein YiiM